MRKNYKTNAAGAVLLYLLLASGSWMFINSYANSFNRLSKEKIVPASLTIDGRNASLSILGRNMDIGLSMPDKGSRHLLTVYLSTSDEIRSAAYLIGVADRE